MRTLDNLAQGIHGPDANESAKYYRAIARDTLDELSTAGEEASASLFAARCRTHVADLTKLIDALDAAADDAARHRALNEYNGTDGDTLAI